MSLRKGRLALALLAVLMLAAGIAACGGSDDSGGADDKQVTITFWDRNLFGEASTSKLPRQDWFSTRAVELFEKANPDIKVKTVYVSGDLTTADNQFRAAGIARNGPDVATLYAGGPTLAFANLLLPLDSYVADIKDQLTGWTSVQENFQPDGKILAVPYGAGSYFEVFYNKKLLKQAGVELTTPPKTWEELSDLIAKVKAGGVDPIVVGDQEGYTGAWVFSALGGGQVGTEGFQQMRNHERKIDDPGVVKGWTAWKDLYATGNVNKDASALKNDEAITKFSAGKAAMLIQGGWYNQQGYESLKDDVGSFPIPQLAGAPNAGALTGGPNVSVAVTKYTKHRDAAIKFVKFLATKDILDLYVKIKQTEPSNHVGADTAEITNPLLRQQADELKGAKTVYPFDNIMPGKVNDLLYRLDPGVLTGKTSPSDAAQQLDEANDAA